MCRLMSKWLEELSWSSGVIKNINQHMRNMILFCFLFPLSLTTRGNHMKCIHQQQHYRPVASLCSCVPRLFQCKCDATFRIYWKKEKNKAIKVSLTLEFVHRFHNTARTEIQWCSRIHATNIASSRFIFCYSLIFFLSLFVYFALSMSIMLSIIISKCALRLLCIARTVVSM